MAEEILKLLDWPREASSRRIRILANQSSGAARVKEQSIG
jgi:hypothetical protein